jgi:hypothetical protein
MRRISIRTLMAFILVSAVFLAALRNASEVWAGFLLLLAFAALGVAVLGAIILWGQERYRCLGFALFSGGYLALALSSLQPQLSTTHLLGYIHARVTSFNVLNFEVSRFDQNSVVYRVVFSDGVRVKNIADSVVNSTPTENLLASMAPANGWRLAFPGATNRDQFERVGHCLFALLAGLVGGAFATWFHARRKLAEVIAR